MSFNIAWTFPVFILGFILTVPFTVFAKSKPNHVNALNLVHVDQSKKYKWIVLNTWNFVVGTNAAAKSLISNNSGLDAVEAGCLACEEAQCDNTVGFGGSPDENGETTLDSMIIDGPNHDFAAVGALRRIKPAISVARTVLERTNHTILVGDFATNFAKEMGFSETTLQTNFSKGVWEAWQKAECQPNYRKNVNPNPRESCGPYSKSTKSAVATKIDNEMIVKSSSSSSSDGADLRRSHDTIGLIVLDSSRDLYVGTSSNGASHKVPGRVGDSVPGAAGYVDNDVGAAVATGDGDIMMRYLPSFKAVDLMRSGESPQDAADSAIAPIPVKYPDYNGAVLVLSKNGGIGSSCYGFSSFTYSYRQEGMNDSMVFTTSCRTNTTTAETKTKTTSGQPTVNLKASTIFTSPSLLWNYLKSIWDK